MNFSYNALNRQGKQVAGLITAESQAIAVAKLQADGYFPTQIIEFARASKTKAHLGGEDLALFALMLADLLGAGMPLDRALGVLMRQGSNPRMRQSTAFVLGEVEAGSSLAAALESQGFPVFFTKMVHAGEKSGQLETVLAHLASYLRKETERRGQVRAALTYPLLLLTAAIVALLFLLVFLVPQMGVLFADFEQSLPWSTTMLMQLGQRLAPAWPLVLLIAVLLGSGCMLWLTTLKGRKLIQQVGLRLPLVGPVILQTITARFARTLGILLRGGVPLLDSFPLLAATAGNLRLQTALVTAQAELREGKPLAKAMDAGILPEMALEMLAVGEESGNLENMLARIASTYEFQAEIGTKRLLSLLEPAIILFMGLIVAFVVSSILLPLFDLNTGLGMP